MTMETTRRRFFHQMAAVSAAGAATATGLLSAPMAQAVGPVQREVRGSQFKLTLAGYSYRNLLTGKNPARVGITDWIDCGGRLHPARGRLIDVPYLKALPLSEYSLARALRAGGPGSGRSRES